MLAFQFIGVVASRPRRPIVLVAEDHLLLRKAIRLALERDGYDVQTNTTRAVTAGLGVEFQRSDDDHPHPDPAHGLAGWTAGDQEMLVYDEFDLWKISPATGQAVCVTDGFGRANKLRLRLQPMRLDESGDDEDRIAVPETIWRPQRDRVAFSR